MKKIIVCVAVLTSVLAVSCKKGDEAKPTTTPAAPVTIDVEYRISSASGQVGVDYVAPDANGVLETKHIDVNRTSQTISFNHRSGYLFSVTAYNQTPSHDVVQVQLFVNGEMKAEASTTTPGQSAVAKGNF